MPTSITEKGVGTAVSRLIQFETSLILSLRMNLSFTVKKGRWYFTQICF